MATMEDITRMASNLTIKDIPQLQSLLERKLKYIPRHILPHLTLNDILLKTARAAHVPNIPPDLQLSFLLRHRTYIDRHKGRPIKDSEEQSLDITRAIFYYHLHDSRPLQRYHDPGRWNLALFTALLSLPLNGILPRALFREQNHSHIKVTPSARAFMQAYLAAVMEHHNTPSLFRARENFIKKWKACQWDLFSGFRASQKKVLHKEMRFLNRKWEEELDAAIVRLGRREYDLRVAPFVGSVVPGRKDQGLGGRVLSHAGTTMGSEGMDVVMYEEERGGNELLEALRVPLLEPETHDFEYMEHMDAPADMRFAIQCVLTVEPKSILLALMRLFPVESESPSVELERTLSGLKAEKHKRSFGGYA